MTHAHHDEPIGEILAEAYAWGVAKGCAEEAIAVVGIIKARKHRILA